MPRKKKFLSFKLPFFKKIKVNKDTFSNIIGILIFGISILGLISFAKQGSVLVLVNSSLSERFGWLSMIVPIILLLLSTHFFNSKKVKFVKPHVTGGLILIFISLLGLFGSGQYGSIIAENLSTDFSGLGKFIILLITFTIGVILFFNTSIDVFLLMIIEMFKKMFGQIAKASPGKLDVNKVGADGKLSQQKIEFISNKSQVQPVIKTLQQPGKPAVGADFSIRPLSSHSAEHWAFPTLQLLDDLKEQKADAGDVRHNSDTIERTLDSFGIRARVVEINQGPTVSQYAIEIAMGTKLSKITGLANDLALALAAPTGQVRIEAPIPGKSHVGIEIPNRRSEIVPLKRMLMSEEMMNDPHPLVVPLGLDVSGKPKIANIGKMPHILIAGTTGSGKSVILNSWICSLLFRTTPHDVRLLLVDPKRVELTQYNGIPHLLTEVIVEPDKILSALKWTVGEMEARYQMFAKVGARNFESYNEKPGSQKIPYIVFIIDELADLMIYAPKEVEEHITRIAQKARATGIHLILATQRPSVDVITGLMKANIPTRMAFNVPSLIDSRVVLDTPGAEKLVGRGDMLFLPSDEAKPRRIQGPYLTEKDVNSVVDFLKQKAPPVEYTDEITEQDVPMTSKGYSGGGRSSQGKMMVGDSGDPLFNQAVDLIYETGKASASLLQRRMSVGYSRAARILDQLEEAGIIGPQQGSKPRDILSRPAESAPDEMPLEE